MSPYWGVKKWEGLAVEKLCPRREFRSLGDAWADTTTPHGRLMLTVLRSLAEFERELIRVRTAEGRSRAKAKGTKMGRKPKLTDHQKREAIKRRDKGEETLAEIGRSYNVSGLDDFEADNLRRRKLDTAHIENVCGGDERNQATERGNRPFLVGRTGCPLRADDNRNTWIAVQEDI